MATTKTPKLQPTDLGYWQWNHVATVATWRWRYEVEDVRVLDRQRSNDADVSRNYGTFHLSVSQDPNRGTWTVKSCGTTGHGATRYRYHLDLHEANEIAAAWLNRRFRIEVQS